MSRLPDVTLKTSFWRGWKWYGGIKNELGAESESVAAGGNVKRMVVSREASPMALENFTLERPPSRLSVER